jgi:hypothetical protein
MFPTQSNTTSGHRPFVGAVGLVNKEGMLVVLSSASTVPTVALPAAVTDIPCGVLVDDGATQSSASSLAGQQVEVQPLNPGENIRIKAYGAGVAGDILVMADPTANAGAQAGMVKKIGNVAGAFVQIGNAEEDFADGQLVLVRPALQLVIVKSTVAAPAAVVNADGAFAGLNSTAVNPTKSDFDALLAQAEILADDVRALRGTVSGMHTALLANRQVKVA